jgi:acyl-CoA thioesterase-1
MKSLSVFLVLALSFSTSGADKFPSLLVYGDSISAGYGISKEKQWSEVLKTEFSKEGIDVEILNTSVSGETTGGGLARIDRTLDELKPTYLLLELGGNDALRGYPPKKIYKNLQQIIEAARKRGIEVFLMQIKILPNYGKRYQSEFESLYSDIANDTGVILIPFMLNEIALNKEFMLNDGIHPNESAQPLMAKFVFDSLKSHLK